MILINITLYLYHWVVFKLKKLNTTTKKVTKKAISKKKIKYDSYDSNEERRERRNKPLTIFSIFALGVLLLVSTYAWFSTSLNVQVRTFNMVVTRNSGLTISLDAINYDSYVDISKVILIDDLKNLYPNNLSQWANNGMIPVSSPGITDPNSYFFDLYGSGGVRYKNSRRQEDGFVSTVKMREDARREYNSYIAFDLFLRNDTGSPISDNLYLDAGTGITMTDEESTSEEMTGLVNSARIGFVKVASVPLNTDPSIVQNLQCNNDCKSAIYEPNDRLHTVLSIERALKYGLHLEDGVSFPTYAYKRAGGPFYVKDTISGAANLNMDYFQLQETITDDTYENTPLFELPNGVTKVRVYVWLEGQDIDSLETDSEGTDITITINFIKDTRGYDSFNYQ